MSRRNLPYFAGAILFLLSASTILNAKIDSDTPVITVILSDETYIYQTFINTFKQTLINKKDIANLNVLTINTFKENKYKISKRTKLIITVGVKATLLATEKIINVPVYATLIPKESFRAIQKSSKLKLHQFSAAFIDQPITRQFNLIKHAMPQARRIGVLASKNNIGLKRKIINIGRDANYSIIIEDLTEANSLSTTLNNIFRKSDIFLVIPEAGAIDQKIASSILLTSYRYQKPVVGYSHAYVKAGALLAIYSTPEQLSREAARSVIKMKKNSWHLPGPSYSSLFTVSVNKWLKKSMGLNIKTEKSIAKAMAAEERGAEK